MTASLFNSAPESACAAYIAMRERANPIAIEAREHCEDLWRDFAEHADPNFCVEFALRMHERWFEMYLTVALLRAGFDVQCPKPGPDVLLTIDGRRVWIEATCATGGAPGRPDSVPVPPAPTPGGPVLVTDRPTDPMTLRIRNSLHAKEQVFQIYIDNGIVQADDVTVVAINVFLIPQAWVDMDDLMRRALYGLGHPTITIDKNTLSAVASGYQERPELEKQSTGSPVSVDPFVDGSMPHVSSVLGSREDAYNRPPRLGDGFVIYPNLSAGVLWPERAIQLGQEWIPTRQPDGDVQLEKASYLPTQ